MTEVVAENEVIGKKVQEKTNDDVEYVEIKDKYGFIYITTNLINGKRYLGQRKFSDGWKSYLGSGTALKNAIKLYTRKNFKKDIVVICDSLDELNNTEYELSVFLNVVESPDWYNLEYGGGGSSGRVFSEETRQKMSDNHADVSGKNNPNYGSHRNAGKNNPNYGKKMSEDHKAKLHKAAMDAWRGQHHTEESKRKMVENRKPFKHSDETKAILSASAKERFSDPHNHPKYGSKMSEEQKEKLSKMAKERYKNPENTPMYGKHLSECTKEKIRNAKKNNMSGYKMIFCHELNELFCSIKEAGDILHIDSSAIAKHCKGNGNYCGRHPITNDPLHWKYVYDQRQKDGTIINGAITLGYITQKQVDDYLNTLKQKGNDTYGTMEEK